MIILYLKIEKNLLYNNFIYCLLNFEQYYLKNKKFYRYKIIHNKLQNIIKFIDQKNNIFVYSIFKRIKISKSKVFQI